MPPNWVISATEEDMTADQLEEAGTRLLAKARQLRNADKIEPKADGTVVRWEANGLTYIAMRKKNRWWSTARGEAGYGLSWAELAERFPAIRGGNFQIGTTWKHRSSFESLI